MLDPNSRYYNIETAQLEQGGRSVRYLTRRMLPALAAQTTLEEYQAAGSERLDLLASMGYGDPLQAYRLIDANPVLHPSELLVARRRIRIALSRL
ncbi:MAG TPA: hypothetical protein PKI49_00540 [Pseudomonadota bacterium]|jgi:hypothetical protein|nr:hypothetical protein [Pseudomonadota bacterium]HND10112.1 hypothetical protein [Pseudomonadota bacterium]HNF97058.1 hypothetical protein [Pseudomonadota bacterium]HNK44831.1 hypothetical protein [Pseudomonadota bacterium]HNN51882.1 hypothetical protein [Pseudomonadota bacterium]